MSMLKIKAILKEYNNSVKYNAKSIGSILKHYRKDKNLTLEEVAADSCSISYLCKVENNQITPSTEILPKLLKRLELSEEDIKYNEDDDWVTPMLNDCKNLHKLYQETRKTKDYKSKLIEFSYKVFTTNDIEEINLIYKDLLDYFIYFNKEEMSLFLYLVMLGFYKQEQYLDAIKVYDEIITMSENKKIIILAEILYLKSLYKTEREIDIFNNYDEITSDLIKYDYYMETAKIRNYHMSFVARKMQLKELEDYFLNTYDRQIINSNLIWYNFYFYKKVDFIKALNYIRKINKNNAYFYILYLITLYKAEKKEELFKELNNLPNFKFKESHLILLEFLKNRNKNDEALEYIRSEILAIKFLTDEAVIIRFLYEELIKLFKDNHYYKESVAILEKYLKFSKDKSVLY